VRFDSYLTQYANTDVLLTLLGLWTGTVGGGYDNVPRRRAAKDSWCEVDVVKRKLS